MLRSSALLAVCACGGFNTPGQEVSTGFALSSSALPPRIEGGGHVLTLSRFEVTAAATAEGPAGDDEVQAAHAVTIELGSRWSELARGVLERGDYDHVKLQLSAASLSGTYDGVAFTLRSPEVRTIDLPCSGGWRVELGSMSAVSVVSEPTAWMGKVDGTTVEPLGPTEENVEAQLLTRLEGSLTAVRDDDHDGVEDSSGH